MALEGVFNKRKEQKIDEAVKVLKDLGKRKTQLHSSRVIANSPLPKHKQKYFERVLAEANRRYFNAREAWGHIMRTLSQEDLNEIDRRIT